MSWTALAATRRNRHPAGDKPNEDFIVVDNDRGIFIVLDGVSRTRRKGTPYVSPSPAAAAARLLGGSIHRALFEAAPALAPAIRLRDAVAQANAVVADYNRQTFPTVDYLENNPAGAVGVVVLVEGELLHYAYLGDCAGRIISPEGVNLFTCCQTDCLGQAIDTLGPPGDERTVKIRRDICNNPSHELAYGVWNGAPEALELLVTGSEPLSGNEIILLSTDGVEPFLAGTPRGEWNLSDPEKLIEQVEGYEAGRPEIRSDDKSVILVRAGGISGN